VLLPSCGDSANGAVGLTFTHQAADRASPMDSVIPVESAL
jgi:hypothetical protein